MMVIFGLKKQENGGQPKKMKMSNSKTLLEKNKDNKKLQGLITILLDKNPERYAWLKSIVNRLDDNLK
jgi:hypothetical protein